MPYCNFGTGVFGLYASWTNWLIICFASITITLIVGYLFAHQIFFEKFYTGCAEKIGFGLFSAWGVVGISVLFAATRGEPIAVDYLRLLMAFVSGAVFSCTWLGWYLAVSLAFNCHNNEAGEGRDLRNFVT